MNTMETVPSRLFSLGKKVFMIGLITCVLMCGLLAVFVITEKRDRQQSMVVLELKEEWGQPLKLNGPVIVTDRHGMNVGYMPSNTQVYAKVNSQLVHRNIYEAEVYTADIHYQTKFDKEYYGWRGDDCNLIVEFNTAYLVGNPSFKINGRAHSLAIEEDCLSCPIKNATNITEDMTLEIDFQVRGTESIFFQQGGRNDTITISGIASNPSFRGEFLPDKRIVNGIDFYAQWIGKTIYSPENKNYVGANFLVGVNHYQKVFRVMNYSFIIILLTFVCILVMEIFKRQTMPLLNYFLIGSALIIFYTLLLSFVEFISFGLAYFMAGSMTVILIAGYVWKWLKSKNMGLCIGGILSIIYIFCYIMLSASTYALLIGSLLLFLALAAMMLASIKLNISHDEERL